jgi:hypothetical protein
MFTHPDVTIAGPLERRYPLARQQLLAVVVLQGLAKLKLGPFTQSQQEFQASLCFAFRILVLAAWQAQCLA